MKEKSTILIVDDSELNRTILADILGDEYNFIEAENGARAIELLRTHTDIDLILLDMVMPEMNGFDVLTAMNNNRQIEDIPVVMISAGERHRAHRSARTTSALPTISAAVRPHGRAPPRGQRADTGRQAEAADAACRPSRFTKKKRSAT